MLLLDQFKAHNTPEVLKAINNIAIQSALVPAGFTSELQPMDGLVNKPIKDILKMNGKKFFYCDSKNF